MEKLLICIFLFFALCSCKQKEVQKDIFSARTDIRFGSKYYSFYLSKDGQAFVIKGESSLYTDSFKVITSDTSQRFKVDSATLFFENINKLRKVHIIDTIHLDAPRVEIYFNNEKIYDAHRWDELFWELYRPVMTQLPRGYNPFRVDDKPF